MKRPKFLIFLFLIIFLTVAILLISGSPVLTYSIGDKFIIPLGTPITWIGLLSFPILLFLSIKKIQTPNTKWYKTLRIILLINLILAFLWVPICFLLSGNISFTFSEKEQFQGGQLAMKIFWIFSYSLVIAPFLLLSLHWIKSIFENLKIRKKL